MYNHIKYELGWYGVPLAVAMNGAIECGHELDSVRFRLPANAAELAANWAVDHDWWWANVSGFMHDPLEPFPGYWNSFPFVELPLPCDPWCDNRFNGPCGPEKFSILHEYDCDDG